MRGLVVSFVLVFFALSVLPLAARFGNFEPELGLRGVVEPPAQVRLGVPSYFDGSFQKAFEENFNSALGFRAALIRSDNQLNFTVFREFAPSAGTAMVLGKKDFIYERQYVDAYNRRDLVPRALLEQKVQRLKLLQDYLAARHEAFLVVISPNKATLYAENLPKKFVYPERLGLPDNYSVFVELLQTYGVGFIDVQRQMFDAKASSPFPSFPNAGAHWNDPWACNVTSRIQEFIQQSLQRPLPGLRCEPILVRDHPEGTERDLADLVNLWFEEELFRPMPYARGRVTAHGSQRPSVLFVGSSFLLQILWYENHYGLQQHDTFYYYYKTRIAYPNQRRLPLDPAQLDWPEEVFGKQAVVMEINAAVVEHVGWGFLEDAERVIHGGEPAPPSDASTTH